MAAVAPAAVENQAQNQWWCISTTNATGGSEKMTFGDFLLWSTGSPIPGVGSIVCCFCWRQTEVHASHLQPFGCRAFYRDHSSTDKLHQRYREGRLLSYEEGTHNYRVWDRLGNLLWYQET
jgi:hypothetical protein